MEESPKKFLIVTVCVLAIFLAGALAALFFLPREYHGHGGSITASDPTETTESSRVPNNPFVPDDFVYEDGYLACKACDYETGVDVSSHQGKIDWISVKNSGISFAMVRLGVRAWGSVGELTKDDHAAANLDGASAAGLKVGAYFFSQAKNVAEAEEEARYALSVLGGRELELPVAFDWEIPDAQARTIFVEKETVTACALAFCKIMEDAGYDTMVYFNPNYASKYMDMEQLADLKFWIAQYGDAFTFRKRADMWQYTQSGVVSGIEKPVDIDMLFHYVP